MMQSLLSSKKTSNNYLIKCLMLSYQSITKCQPTVISHSATFLRREKTNMLVLNRIQSSHNLFKLISTETLKRWTQIHTSSVLLKQKTDDCLNLEISGENLKFPYVWLRDNCQCENCFHTSAKSRTIDWTKFALDIKPKDVARHNKTVKVTWDDGHHSEYGLNWLKLRSFTPKNQKKYAEAIFKPKKKTWNGVEFPEVCSKHDYNKILTSDEALHDWLEKLSIYGVALIQNTPDNETAIDSIVEKIGFTRRTHYGVKFIVQHVNNTSNVAYLSNNLQMHTDLPYYEYCPGVNMLHCLVQTQSGGGENLLSDCHFVAHYLKQHHPEEYRLLTEIEVEWSDIGIEDGNEFFKLYRSPVICLDKHGEITRINFSVPQRGSHFPDDIENVKPWYEAHKLFYDLNHEYAARFKTSPGDILTFDNIRLLHGRNAYEDSSNNVRKLIGAYVDWDEVYSRLRCLKVKLNHIDGL